MNLFGGKKRASPRPQASTQQSIQGLNEALENLEKREKHITKLVEKEQAEAKKKIQAKNKPGAMMCLKRKKMYEGQLEKINGTRMTIENQKMALENANFNQEVMKAMSQGASALQNVNEGMTIDRVDETMDNIQEQMDVANEISEAISNPMGIGGYEDETALEQELADLEAEDLDATLLNVENTPTPEVAVSTDAFPSAPTTVAEPTLSKEEEELAALEASMAMPS